MIHHLPEKSNHAPDSWRYYISGQGLRKWFFLCRILASHVFAFCHGIIHMAYKRSETLLVHLWSVILIPLNTPCARTRMPIYPLIQRLVFQIWKINYRTLLKWLLFCVQADADLYSDEDYSSTYVSLRVHFSRWFDSLTELNSTEPAVRQHLCRPVS